VRGQRLPRTAPHQLAEDDKVNMMDAAEKATAMMTRS